MSFGEEDHRGENDIVIIAKAQTVSVTYRSLSMWTFIPWLRESLFYCCWMKWPIDVNYIKLIVSTV